MRSPLLLDLFCGAGGAAEGYRRAGFKVVGVDIKRQPHYPFPMAVSDAMTFPIASSVDMVHASPPCQDHSVMAHFQNVGNNGTGWMLQATIDRLEAWGGPYVVENVPGARFDWNLQLCGATFNLEVLRHRLFRTRPWILGPMCSHERGGTKTGQYVAFRHSRNQAPGRRIPPRRSEREFHAAMGLSWMNQREVRDAVPPVYTEWIGNQLMEHIGAQV